MKRYVAGPDSKTVQEFNKEFDAFREWAKHEEEFIRKRVENMKNENKRVWGNCFQRLKDEGLIEKELKREDFSISYNSDHKQLFIEPREENEGDFLSRLFGDG